MEKEIQEREPKRGFLDKVGVERNGHICRECNRNRWFLSRLNQFRLIDKKQRENAARELRIDVSRWIVVVF